ncbi:beta-carotene 15,15'-monooxygenase [Pedobacter yulinensis]|uniref:Beta-carotene 15,15'-monooxygenase n=2 Tax=Pedobacter yulinensis TaxID=2126353 RepID=A0A2T3HNL2_9SPHI|nr:beta-carotene 15,15'-monooxygenase [Pedobacter yulinensis]
MINQFRTLQPANLILLLVYAFFMRAALFVHMPEQLNFAFLEPFARLLIDIPIGQGLSPAGNVFFAALISIAQALWFNRVVNNHNLMGKPNYLPALLYLTAGSLFMPFMVLSPTMMCNFLLILMIDKFLKIGKSTQAIMPLFDVGMLVAVGTLIYFPFVSMLLMLWLGLLVYRSFNWREWVSGLLGFLTVFFFLGVFYYWNDNLEMFYRIWLPLTNKFPSVFQINYNDYIVLVPVIVIIVLGTLQLRENFFRSFISTRKAFQLLFCMFLIAMASFYLKPGVRLSHFLLCVPPGAVLLAYYFTNASKRWFYESLFILLVLSIQYFLFV